MKHGPDVARVPESRCLNCHAKLDAVGTGDRFIPADPHSGDVTLCIKCGAVMMLDDQLRLRGLTTQEMDALLLDRQWMNEVTKMVRDEVTKMVRAIHFVRRMDG